MSSKIFKNRLKEARVILPPLAGYTDYPYRKILSEFGVPFMCTEMINSEAVLRENPRTIKMLKKPDGGHLHGVQIFGGDPISMELTAEYLDELGFDYIDLNMGCTVKNIIQNGAGVSLMGDPEKAIDVVSRVVDAVSIPVTCKIRLGKSRGEQNTISFSRMLEEAGVSLITVHGRSGEKKFGEPINCHAIKEVVESVDIPVVGNGDIFTGAAAVEMINNTGVNAVMPGRVLIGNPWIVEEIMSAISGISYTGPSFVERKNVCLRHLQYIVDFLGEKDGVVSMRRVLPKYFSGAVHASDLRKKMVDVFTVDDMKWITEQLSFTGDQIYFKK